MRFERQQTLGELAEIVSGQSPAGSELTKSPVGVPFFQGARDFGVKFPSERIFTTSPKKLAEAGDVLLSVRAPVGRVNRAHRNVAIGRGLFALRGKPGVLLTDYLEYVLLAMSSRWGAHESSGSVFSNLSRSNLASVVIELPSIEDQRAIAEVLTSLDDRISHLTGIARTSDRLRETLFQDCVLDSVDRAKWPSVLLDEVCATQYGFTASASNTAVGPQFVRVTDINKNPWVDWATTPFAEVPPDQLPKYALRPGDILVARMADPGKCALIDSEVDAVFASYLVRIRTRPAGLAQFVYGFLSSREYARYAAGVQYGTVQKNMNARVIVGCDMPLPPQDVIDRYSATASALRARMAAALEEARAVAELRGALLPRLVSGILRIKHPERLLDQVA